MKFRREKDVKLRKEEIIDAAARLAVKHGYQNVKRELVADEVKCSAALLSYHFGTMEQLRRDIMRHAIKNQVLIIVAQGLAAGDAHAKKAPLEIRQKALASIA